MARIEDVQAEVDLGVIARTYAVPAFDPDAWLAGRGSASPALAVPAEALRERSCSTSRPARTPPCPSASRAVPLRGGVRGGQAPFADGAVRVEVLAPRTAWLHVTVEDGATGKPGPPGCTSGPRTGATCRPTGTGTR